MDNYIGKRLDGRYEIIELIGSGGMANVYRAFDRLDNREVAVKILREEFLDNQEFVRRFRNESKAVGLLSHPNIVKVFDVNFSDTVQYIVMEYINGITLKDYIDQQGVLSWKDAVFFTTQVLRALQHAHDHGIVHRDIKPQNIMLLPDGSIKVMDFGIARFSRSETRTITDKAIGSVHYISPEQAKGDMTDFKADIYSLGVMLYEMLTGQLPFESDSAVSVAIKQISDEPTRPRDINPDIPEGLEEITLKAMAKDPEKRYQSAAQMLRDIEDFKRNPSIRFEYKYISDDSPTRYLESPVSKGKKDTSKKPSKKRKGLTIPLMLGITAACVVGAFVLMLMVFSLGDNPLFSNVEDVKLPDFRGMSLAEVENSNYKFKFDIQNEFNANAPAGQIYDQKPNPDRQIKENGKVTLYVSKGTEQVKIPNGIIGMKTGEALTSLQNLGLVVKIHMTQDESAADNTVVRISPEEGKELSAGSIVEIYINSVSRQASVSVPQLVGLNYNEARALLNTNSLRMGNYTEEANSAEKGTIIRQETPEGTIVAQNTAIDVVISSGPQDKVITASVNLPATIDGVSGYTVTAYVNGGVVGTRTGGGSTWQVAVTVSSDATLEIRVSGAGVSARTIYTFSLNYESGQAVLTSSNTGSQANRTALGGKISEANGLLSGTTQSADGSGLASGTYWCTPATYSALQSAVGTAQGVYNNSNATQAEIDSATSALTGAVGAFNAGRQLIP